MKKIILFIALMMPMTIHAKSVEMLSMGECKISYYCSCSECSGPWGRQTATGATCYEGRTVAVDPTVIAYGTKLLIDGHVYTAEDCGSSVKGDWIDIYLDDHEMTEELGIRYTDVYIVKGGGFDE